MWSQWVWVIIRWPRTGAPLAISACPRPWAPAWRAIHECPRIESAFACLLDFGPDGSAGTTRGQGAILLNPERVLCYLRAGELARHAGWAHSRRYLVTLQGDS